MNKISHIVPLKAVTTVENLKFNVKKEKAIANNPNVVKKDVCSAR